jgi:hypothetical protein
MNNFLDILQPISNILSLNPSNQADHTIISNMLHYHHNEIKMGCTFKKDYILSYNFILYMSCLIIKQLAIIIVDVINPF